MHYNTDWREYNTIVYKLKLWHCDNNLFDLLNLKKNSNHNCTYFKDAQSIHLMVSRLQVTCLNTWGNSRKWAVTSTRRFICISHAYKIAHRSLPV